MHSILDLDKNWNMFKNITQIYCLLVCLISVIILTVSLSSAINNTIRIFVFDYEYTDVLENFIESDDKNEEARSKKQELSYIKEQKRHSWLGIINSFGWILVSSLFFMIHWRLNKRYINTT